MKRWCIVSYSVGQTTPQAVHRGGVIDSSVGRPYAELKTIARRMSHNGEGQRYAVREAPVESIHE